MQCPVCKKTYNQNETFCSQCSWEFKMFVGGAPPEEEQRLKIAKRNWQRMLSGATSNAKPVKIDDSNKSEYLYSENTPVPDLKRDAFETVKEFRKRIADYKPVPAGKAELIRDEYDINTGIFPIKISWKEWVETIISKSKETHIIAERDLASSMYESGHEHPVYTLLGADNEKAVVNRIDLYAINQPFKIETIFYKKPQYPRRSKPFDSVSDEEAQTRFNLDKNWRPKKYVDFIDVYANIEETERIRLCNELKEHKETVMLAQYIRDQGREQGIEQGIRQGETYLLCHMIAKKYKVAPEQLSSNIEKLSAKSLMELSEIILERNSYDKVDTWIRQQCLREIGEKQ